jgi:uncharacterized protein (UPF0332 family)
LWRWTVELKARENLEAARVLSDSEAPYPNAAMTRAYYAAYQACWCAMEGEGAEVPEPRKGVRYFPHETLPYEALDARVLNDQGSQDLDYLCQLRVKADYHVEGVTLEEVQAALKLADALLERLLGEEPTA